VSSIRIKAKLDQIFIRFVAEETTPWLKKKVRKNLLCVLNVEMQLKNAFVFVHIVGNEISVSVLYLRQRLAGKKINLYS